MRTYHTPARTCDLCEGYCLQKPSIDDAMTALAVATTRRDRLAALIALKGAADVELKLAAHAIECEVATQ